jgi:DNA-binding CsgD family transcriptional regulator
MEEREQQKRGRMKSLALRTHSVRLGFACFLTLNATTLWGGVFPFFPVEAYAPNALSNYHLFSSLTFCGTLLTLGALASVRRKLFARKDRLLTPFITGILLSSMVMLLIAMQPTFASAGLLYGAAILTGASSAFYYVLWQRVFTSIDLAAMAPLLFSATALSALFYVVFAIISAPYDLYLSIGLLIPLGAVALFRSQSVTLREGESRPEGTAVDRLRLKELVLETSAPLLCITVLSLLSGLVRSISFSSASEAAAINVASMAGLFVAALLLAGTWKYVKNPLVISKWYQWLFPPMATGFLLFPFFGRTYTYFFVGVTYMVFALISMLMMLSCAQFAHRKAINPIASYGLIAGFFYLMNSAGFSFGSMSSAFIGSGFSQMTVLALLSVYLLAVILFAIRRIGKDGSSRISPAQRPALSFATDATSEATAAPEPVAPAEPAVVSGSAAPAEPAAASGPAAPGKPVATPSPVTTAITATEISYAGLTERYSLSKREHEIMELLLKGRDVPYIAEALFLSQNTVRTHNKSLYRKLGVHSKRELIDLFERTNKEPC